MQESQEKIVQSTLVGISFTREPLLGEFGYLVVGKKAHKMLKGMYVPPPGMDM